jgi:peptide deformylase
MLKLVSEHDPILKQKAEIIPDIHLMTSSGGIGLAAPQVGLPWRLLVMYTDNQDLLSVLNPKIVESSKNLTSLKEGCLSFPGLELSIRRPESVLVSYTNLYGNEVTEQMYGMKARCLLHELDHINGVVFTDLVPKTKLFMAQTKRKRK